MDFCFTTPFNNMRMLLKGAVKLKRVARGTQSQNFWLDLCINLRMTMISSSKGFAFGFAIAICLPLLQMFMETTAS